MDTRSPPFYSASVNLDAFHQHKHHNHHHQAISCGEDYVA